MATALLEYLKLSFVLRALYLCILQLQLTILLVCFDFVMLMKLFGTLEPGPSCWLLLVTLPVCVCVCVRVCWLHQQDKYGL